MAKPEDMTDARFDAEVFGSDIPVLIDFWAPWCGPCRMVAPLLEEVSAEYESRLKVVKVNVDEEPGLAGDFRIQSIPTLVIVKDGAPVEGLIGAPARAELKEFIETHI